MHSQSGVSQAQLGYESFECRSKGSIWFHYGAIYPGLRLFPRVAVPRCSYRCRSREQAVRHPLSTTGSGGPSEGAVAVGEVGGLVVELRAHEAVPQDLQPAVAEGAQGGVVAFAAGDLSVVELPGPAGGAQRAERPLLDRVGQVAVAGQPGRHHQLRLARAAGDGGFAGVASKGVRRPELLGVVADLAGDPGGEAVTKPWEAEVDLAARQRLPQLVLLWLAGAAVSGRAQQQL